uniref:Uncharacterized protein n=1 Tax=Cucumis sativus TaxID=3659 RepID=A0A0A0KWM2_CUCSA
MSAAKANVASFFDASVLSDMIFEMEFCSQWFMDNVQTEIRRHIPKEKKKESRMNADYYDRAEEVEKKIKEEMTEVYVSVVPPDYAITSDLRFNRVWLFVDSSGKVIQTPSIG